MDKKWLLWIIFVVVFVLVFRSFFSNSPLSWGDAPFFYPENLQALYNPPFLWDFRNDNFGAPQFHILWLYVPTFLYGLLYTFLGLENNSLIRIIFYFPSTLLAILGSWVFISQYTKNFFAKFLGTFLYTFNTYFLLLLDGGQVGVALSYGLFPLVSFLLLRYFRKYNIDNFLLAIFGLFLISNVDLRIAILSIVFVVLLFITDNLFNKTPINIKQNFVKLTFLLIVVSLLNAFWLVPFLINSGVQISPSDSSNGLVNLMHSFLLFQPQFPLNEFGTVLPIPFYFGLIPFFVFAGWLVFSKYEKKVDRNLVIFGGFYLFYVFLAKGSNEPFGQIYAFAVNNIPFGVAFRDSTKFFIPLLLVASCLLATSVDLTQDKIRKVSGKILFTAFVLIFLMILVYPALVGKLTGALGNQNNLSSYNPIYLNLRNDKEFSRTVWFDEKPPFGFADWNHPAISANSLYKLRPFASMTDGDYDLYGFLHNDQLTKWFDLLGIRYAFFPENQREKIRDENDIKERTQFIDFLGAIPHFTPINWNLDFPAYQVSNGKPHIFGQNVLVAVVGGEGIYKNLFNEDNFDLSKQGFVFLEDGRVDPNFLKSINKSDLALLFGETKNEEDLAMSFLQDKFLNLEEVKNSQWGFYSSGDYLKWKSEMLKSGIKNYDFDYGKGIGFSNIKGETINFDLQAPEGKYVLAVRHTNATDSGVLKVKVNNEEFDLFNENPNHFKWSFIGPFNLPGDIDIAFTNEDGFQAINTIALILEQDLISARNTAKDILKSFPTFYINKEGEYQKFINELDPKMISVNHKIDNPTKYYLNVPKEAKWIVFTDSFNKNWKLQNATVDVLPGFAMINYFYIGDLTQNINDPINLQINFLPQESENKWVIVSLVSGIIFAFICLGRLVYKITQR